MAAHIPMLKRRSLSAQVAETLREMILTGQLRAEDRLVQDELAEQLGVSTMPVREALLKLSHEGFVEANPNRSFTITRMTREDIADIFWIHALLAGELARRAATKADPPTTAGLERALATESVAMKAGRLAEADQANYDFHMGINYAAAAPVLLRVLNTNRRFMPDNLYQLLKGEWVAQSQQDHAEILAAIARHDPETAHEAAVRHARHASALLTAHFIEQGFWRPPAHSAAPNGDGASR